MSDVRARFQEILPESATPAQTLKALAQAKAEVVTDKWSRFAGKNMQGTASFSTREGEVVIGGIRHRPPEGPKDLDSVEVWVGGKAAGSPTWRIINPPTLVSDPAGSVMIAEKAPGGKSVNRRYREDPLAAIAEFIATNQGRSEKG